MLAREAYWDGYDNVGNYVDLPEYGQTYFTDALGEIVCNSENWIELYEALLYEGEMNSRDFSPWEFIANEINKDEERSEMLWEHYDKGVTAAIRRNVTEAKRNGILLTYQVRLPGSLFSEEYYAYSLQEVKRFIRADLKVKRLPNGTDIRLKHG